MQETQPRIRYISSQKQYEFVTRSMNAMRSALKEFRQTSPSPHQQGLMTVCFEQIEQAYQKAISSESQTNDNKKLNAFYNTVFEILDVTAKEYNSNFSNTFFKRASNSNDNPLEKLLI